MEQYKSCELTDSFQFETEHVSLTHRARFPIFKRSQFIRPGSWPNPCEGRKRLNTPRTWEQVCLPHSLPLSYKFTVFSFLKHPSTANCAGHRELRRGHETWRAVRDPARSKGNQARKCLYCVAIV